MSKKNKPVSLSRQPVEPPAFRIRTVPYIYFLSLTVWLIGFASDFGTLADHFFTSNMFYAAKLHFMKNGPFSLPYYTAAWGGGLPLYGDPNSMTFTILQILINLLPDLYLALKLSFLTCSILAFLGSYKLFRRLEIDEWSSTVAAIAFASNGYMLSRWIIGHLCFHAQWTLPWVAYHILKIYRAEDFKTIFKSSVWISCLMAYCAYAADFPSLVMNSILTLALILTLILNREAPKGGRNLFILAVIPVIFGALVASKTMAAHDYMKWFPRKMDNFIMSWKNIAWITPHSLFDTSLKTFSEVMPDFGGWHEYCGYIGIVTALIILASSIFVAYGRKKIHNFPSIKNFAFISTWLIASLLLVSYMVHGEGLFYSLLKKLPFFSSYSHISRYLGALPLPVAALGGIGLTFLSSSEKTKRWATVLGLLMIADMFLYTVNQQTYKQRPFPKIEYPQSFSDIKIIRWYPGAGGQALQMGIGDCYTENPQFGYGPHPTLIDPHFPPDYIFPDGTYNVMDPQTIIYPSEVGREPRSRLPASVGKETLDKFLSFKDAGFYVPRRQKIANFISLFALLGSLFIVCRPSKRTAE